MQSIEEIEIWKPIPNFEKWYEASNLGNIRRTASGSNTYIGKIIKPSKMKDGYLMFYPNINDGKKHCMLVHRAVALTFLGDPGNAYEVNHKNLIKSDNHLQNLEWVTPSENIKHAFKNGKQALKGSKNGNARLSEDEVIEIRNLYASGNSSIRKLCREYKVGFGTVFRIIHNNTWKHI